MRRRKQKGGNSTVLKVTEVPGELGGYKVQTIDEKTQGQTAEWKQFKELAIAFLRGPESVGGTLNTHPKEQDPHPPEAELNIATPSSANASLPDSSATTSSANASLPNSSANASLPNSSATHGNTKANSNTKVNSSSSLTNSPTIQSTGKVGSTPKTNVKEDKPSQSTGNAPTTGTIPPTTANVNSQTSPAETDDEQQLVAFIRSHAPITDQVYKNSSSGTNVKASAELTKALAAGKWAMAMRSSDLDTAVKEQIYNEAAGAIADAIVAIGEIPATTQEGGSSFSTKLLRILRKY